MSKKHYVYVWADGVYSNVRMDNQVCFLVITGSDETGRKELLALSDGYRESAASWEEVLTDLQQRGLKNAPIESAIKQFYFSWQRRTECGDSDKSF